MAEHNLCQQTEPTQEADALNNLNCTLFKYEFTHVWCENNRDILVRRTLTRAGNCSMFSLCNNSINFVLD